MIPFLVYQEQQALQDNQEPLASLVMKVVEVLMVLLVLEDVVERRVNQELKDVEVLMVL